MAYQQLTPPMMFEDDFELQCPGGSASTIESCFPQDWSPDSVLTAATTPPKSPYQLKVCGPALLPKVRLQDQIIDRRMNPSYFGHSRTTSLPVNGNVVQPQIHRVYRPGFDRRSTSPPNGLYQASPAAAPSPFDHMINDEASSRRPSMANMRSVSTSNIRSHSRNSSATSVDALMLSRFGYPTYRHSPSPAPAQQHTAMPISRTPSALSHLAPITMPGGHVQSYPQRRRTASPPANPSRLAQVCDIEPTFDFETTTALSYLTAPNPELAITQRTIEPPRGSSTHFWFDVRNVRSWEDFTVSTISSSDPLLWRLLQTPAGRSMLPETSKVNTSPETSAQLVEACALHHAVKVNAALKLAQGDKHMALRTLKSAPGPRQQPEFVSSYQCDVEKTIYGDGRGRVVGVVKSWEQWNSGMRSGRPADQMKYLQGLAQLQRFMREHGTRYGFIMTEIEVVCVRAGGPPSESTTKPLFGFVEVATPVRIATSGVDQDGMPNMTAGLALWWLHMLAREDPFPGQYHWRLNVGPPGDLSRQHCLDRDEWMPKLIQHEKREAKRVRGWVLPGEPLSKRECGRVKRNIKA
ncbi:hypothetical protein LTR56_016169 [Elasticomyces elasticus]|nr:hypothetical protein LTR56_016169 [Elasticomyces elasticus]KAK3642128.1 hypothetical protein LTR22_016249 [Elasticomyces elasticus]KAK4914176.1 hypothetical protein LTR49_017529 [Elasticomyces elasticus]KAK5762537.1 hypothetical protein LTS12_007328 [Elasticomyces elasticus]